MTSAFTGKITSWHPEIFSHSTSSPQNGALFNSVLVSGIGYLQAPRQSDKGGLGGGIRWTQQKDSLANKTDLDK